MTRADNYAYAIAYVRALRSHLLNREQYEALLKAKDDLDVLRYLSNTVYSTYLKNYSGQSLRPKDVDSIIFEDYYNVFKELMNTSTTKQARQILEIAYLRHEASCLKNIMRLVTAGVPQEESVRLITPSGRYTSEVISELLKARDLKILLSQVNDLKIREIAFNKIEKSEETKSSIPIEMAIDRFHLSSLWAVVNKLDNWDKEPMRRIIGTEIDITNMSLIFRGKQLGMSFALLRDLMIPIKYKLGDEVESSIESVTALEAMQAFASGQYGDTISNAISEYQRKRTLISFELALKRHFVKICSRTFIGYPFGIGPLLAFLNLKYIEALNIRTILLGKRDKKPSEDISYLLLLPS